MWTEDHKRSDANHIACINLIQSNATHCAKLMLMKVHESYVDTSTAQSTAQDQNVATTSVGYLFFLQTIIIPKCKKINLSTHNIICVTCCGNRTRRYEQQPGAALPTSPQMQHPYYIFQKLLNSGLSTHVTLVNFTTVQMNEMEPRRSNPAVFPKIRSICYVVVAISIVEIATTT